MRLTLDKAIQLMFYAIVAYLILVHYKGGVALTRTTFGGVAGLVESLQGRGGSSTVSRQTKRR